MLEGDLRWHDDRRVATNDTLLLSPVFGVVPVHSEEDLSQRKVLSRLGARYRLDDSALVRVAYQDWIKPVSLVSMAPVATAGVPLDDRVVSRGGREKRLRAQLEYESGPKLYATAFADAKRIENRMFSQKPFFVEDDEKIRRLRDFDYGRLAASDLYEFISPPEFEGARIVIAGAALNAMLSRTLSASARYEYTQSRNTSEDPERHGRPVPYHPRHAVAAAFTWVSPVRLYLTARGVYRTERFRDEMQIDRLAPGWDVGADLFWESADKRVRWRFGVDNGFRASRPEQYSTTLVLNF